MKTGVLIPILVIIMSAHLLALLMAAAARVSFLGAEANLLAGSARNAYHTRYHGVFGGNNLPCATLCQGVFAAGAVLTLLSLVGSVLYYCAYSKANTGGWEKHQNDGLGMAAPNLTPQPLHQAGEFGEV